MSGFSPVSTTTTGLGRLNPLPRGEMTTLFTRWVWRCGLYSSLPDLPVRPIKYLFTSRGVFIGVGRSSPRWGLALDHGSYVAPKGCVTGYWDASFILVISRRRRPPRLLLELCQSWCRTPYVLKSLVPCRP